MLQSRSLGPPFINRWYLRWELTPALFWWHWAWIRFLLSVLGFYKESDLGYRIAWNCRTWYFSFKTNFTPFFHAYICSLSFSVLSIMNFGWGMKCYILMSFLNWIGYLFFFFFRVRLSRSLPMSVEKSVVVIDTSANWLNIIIKRHHSVLRTLFLFLQTQHPSSPHGTQKKISPPGCLYDTCVRWIWCI